MQAVPVPSPARLKDTMLSVGRDLVLRRMEEHGLSITALALRLGVSRRRLSSVLNARAPLTEALGRKLAAALGLDAALLLCLRHHGRVVKPLSEVRLPGVVLLSDPTEPMDHWWDED